jgi:hypothetical protein
MNQTQLIKRLLPLVTDIKWERLEDYLSYDRQTLVETLIKSTDIKQINKLQGEIKALDSILALPHTVKRVATS